jgi:hypothetical protein
MPCNAQIARVLCLVIPFLSLISAPTFGQDESGPHITSIRFVSFKADQEPKREDNAVPPTQASQPSNDKSKESSINKKPPSVTFTLSLEGKNLPTQLQPANVVFYTQDPAQSVTVNTIISAQEKEVLVSATAKAGTKITRIKLAPANSANVADTHDDFVISITENPPKPQLNKFQVKIEHEKNKDFPNVHTAILTKESGECGFSENPHRMSIDLLPSGATDLNILQPSSDRIELRFIAASDYEPTGVIVTGYDGTDLDARKVNCVGEVKKAAPDPNKPKVTKTEIVFVSRSHGMGRLRIYGEGFGDFEPPPFPVDDYLWNCIEQFHIRGTDRYQLGTEQREFDDFEQRIEACMRMLKAEYVQGAKEDLIAAGCALEGKTHQASATCPGAKIEREENEDINKPDEPAIHKQMEYAKANPANLLMPRAGEKDSLNWREWQDKVRKGVTVSVHSRNPDIQVEKVELVNANDKMLDVYFEFTRYRGFSYPLRLESSTITIRKKVNKSIDSAKDGAMSATIQGPKLEIYNEDYDIAPKRDPNLTYHYTIFSHDHASTLLGKGVAENFYVLQLSVVNNAEKKVTVPLSSIQAEIEWRRGEIKSSSTQPVAFVQGPPTLPPIPLALVASTFDTYQKVKGLRARFFNGLDATTIIATALVPFGGPSLKDATVFFSGGFVPGLRKAFGDPSSQQLQNLTSMSWESTETLPAKGGSTEKLIYIPRKSPDFQTSDLNPAAKLEIASILGLEVAGFEVTESEPKAATPESKTAPKPESSDESEEKATSPESKPPEKEKNPAPEKEKKPSKK